MPTPLPYLASNKNVGALFEKIASAKVPPKFTYDFLQNAIGQVTGTDADMSARIASTFSVLTKLGDFSSKKKDKDEEANDGEETPVDLDTKTKTKGLRAEFHYNIQVHLPANGTEETYLNIFNAIRKTFQ